MVVEVCWIVRPHFAAPDSLTGTAKPLGPADADIREAVDALLQGGFSCIPVVDDHDVPQGIVSWRDVLRHLSALGNVT